MTTSIWSYGAALAEQLRANGVPEPQVRDIVAQVEAHVRATGEDPVDAFGQATAYAAQWRPLSVRRWLTQVALGLLAAAGVAVFVPAVAAGTSWTAPVQLHGRDLYTFCWLAGILAIIPWTANLWLGRRVGSRLGRPGGVPAWGYRLVFVVLSGVGVAAVFWRLGEEGFDRTVAEGPRWLLVSMIALVLPALVFGRGQPGNSSFPKPPTEGRRRRRFPRFLDG